MWRLCFRKLEISKSSRSYAIKPLNRFGWLSMRIEHQNFMGQILLLYVIILLVQNVISKNPSSNYCTKCLLSPLPTLPEWVVLKVICYIKICFGNYKKATAWRECTKEDNKITFTIKRKKRERWFHQKTTVSRWCCLLSHGSNYHANAVIIMFSASAKGCARAVLSEPTVD